MKKLWVACALILSGCASSGPVVKSQAYARLSNHRTFEYEFPTVWKSIESALKNNKVVSRDPAEVDALEMKKLTHRSLETDWIYGQSRDKYQEYEANGSPRKIYLQTRVMYEVDARSVMGGTDVVIRVAEEVERLKTDGTSDGFEKSNSPDPSRANELLERINGAILSAAP